MEHIRPTEQQIQEAAYYKWQKIGCPILGEEGQRNIWMTAEQELLKANGINYRLLLKTDQLEIRKYQPCKRVVTAASREYYLQFPYLIFAVRHHPSGSYLYVGFAKQNDDVVYFPSLPNMNPQTWSICLGRHGGHFQQKSGTTLDQLIELFWITEFDDFGLGWAIAHRSLTQNFQGRYNYWKGLNLSEVLDSITYMPRSFDDFVQRISKHYGDMEMRHLISDYTGCEEVAKPKELDNPELPQEIRPLGIGPIPNVRILPPKQINPCGEIPIGKEDLNWMKIMMENLQEDLNYYANIKKY